jgi:hypothetical protein
MRVAVVGSRGFSDYRFLAEVLDHHSVSAIVSGGAEGADSLAGEYAKSRGLELQCFFPDYAKYGKRAPLVRNSSIVGSAQACVAFWNGASRGTSYTIELARKVGIPVEVYRV